MQYKLSDIETDYMETHEGVFVFNRGEETRFCTTVPAPDFFSLGEGML